MAKILQKGDAVRVRDNPRTDIPDITVFKNCPDLECRLTIVDDYVIGEITDIDASYSKGCTWRRLFIDIGLGQNTTIRRDDEVEEATTGEHFLFKLKRDSVL